MSPQQRTWPDVVASLVLLAVAGAACFVLAVVWAADFDGDDAESSVAGVSAAVLAVGVVVAVVAGAVGRRWRSVWLTLVVVLVVATVPWLGVL